MIIRYLRSFICYAICVFFALGSEPVCAQLNSGSFTNNSDFGFRRVDINEIISTTYLRDSTYIYLVQEEDSDDWTLQEKVFYDYNNQGKETVRNVLSNSSGIWKNKLQIRSNYISDFLSNREESFWSNENLTWNSSFRNDFTYNYIGLIDEITDFTFSDSSWLAKSKTSYSYNSNHYISEEAKFKWDENSDSWLPTSRYYYSYTSNMNLKKEVYQIWDDSLLVWVNKMSKIYDYDPSHNLVSTTRRSWNSDEDSWLETGIVFIAYNDKGQVKASQQESINANQDNVPTKFEEADYDNEGNIGQIVTSEWSEDTGSWHNYEKQVHFWAEYQHGNLDNRNNEIDCFFANPYTIGLPLYCENLKKNVLYTMSIYDLTGRYFYSGQFFGDEVFRIRENLEPGYYLFQITGGLDSHSEKIYIKN